MSLLLCSKPLPSYSRPNMSTEKKYYIIFMYKHLNYNIKQIQDHPSIKDDNGNKPQLKTIKLWIDRYEESGTVEPKKLPGNLNF